MSASAQLVQSVKALLRERRMTYRDLAAAIGVSEPTIKRDLSRGDFSLARLDRICEALRVTLADLTGRAQAPGALSVLTETQEQALVRDPRLLLLTYLLANDWKSGEITSTFRLDENEYVRLLLRLDQLGIVDFRPPLRVRKLTARNFSWRKDGPVQAFFVQRVAPEFLRGSFDPATDELHFLGGLFSQRSIARVQEAIERFVVEFETLARADARLPLSERDGCSALLAFRRWEFSEFTRLRRR